MSVAFIPTAADVYEKKDFIEDDRNALLKLGFHVIEIHITGKSQEELFPLFENIDVIFVA